MIVGKEIMSYINQEIRRSMKSHNEQVEKAAREFMRANKTHRMNVRMIVGKLPTYNPYKMTIESVIGFELIKPKGWRLPLE